MTASEIFTKQFFNLIRETQIMTPIKRDYGFFVVSSVYTMDSGFETMIFPADENGEIINFHEYYCRHYEHYEEMRKNHEYLVSQWEWEETK